MLLLECRLEQMQAAVATAREEADHLRTRLAEMAARETGHARRYCLIHEELAEARAEIAVLHRHLERSEALRAELAGHLFEAGPTEDAEELMRLRRRALAEDQRAAVSERTISRLRERVEALVSSRETLLTRIAEWQQLIREDGPEAADLSEFLAELRREILDLEHRNAGSDAREARLRERLALAGVDPDGDAEDGGDEADAVEPHGVEAPAEEGVEGEDEADTVEEEVEVEVEVSAAGESAAELTREATNADAQEEEATEVAGEESAEREPAERPARTTAASGRTDVLVAELLDAQLPELRADLLLRLGRTGDQEAVGTVRPWTKSSEPSVRAAAYEALGRLLERSPDELEPHVRAGIADDDARVRRRVVLAAATARGLDANALLDPLREDPDPQVRRLIRQVLRQSPTAGRSSETHPSLRA